MRASTAKPSSVATTVQSEQAHGFRSCRRRLLWPSTMLSGVMSFAGEVILKTLSFAVCGSALSVLAGVRYGCCAGPAGCCPGALSLEDSLRRVVS